MGLRGRVCCVFVGASLLVACEGEGPKTPLSYTADARRAYEAAMEQYSAHNWLDAENQLREVKRKYSYSKYARMAELRLADADYEQEKYPEAIHAYRDFIHAHRSDSEDIAYARSRIADATFAEIPESVLMPAAEERDQGTVLESYKELQSFLADYPEAKEAGHIRDLLGQVTAHLMRHELYVARFYLNKDNYDATVSRVTYALRQYGDRGTGLESDALLLLGQTYLQMHKWDDARRAFQQITRDYAQSPSAVKAAGYLDHLRQLGV
jgi:outer membrane protein assembly factor BamD